MTGRKRSGRVEASLDGLHQPELPGFSVSESQSERHRLERFIDHETRGMRKKQRPRRVVHVDTTKERNLWELAWSAIRIIRGGLNTPKTYRPNEPVRHKPFHSLVSHEEVREHRNSGLKSFTDRDALPNSHTMAKEDAQRLRDAFPERLRRNKRP